MDTAASVTVTLNGEAVSAGAGTRLLDLLASRGVSPERIAVERNGQVVPRGGHRDIVMAEGDVFEVVHFVGGG